MNGIPPSSRFVHLAMRSRSAPQPRSRLQADLGQPLNQTVIFDYPTLRSLVEQLETDVLHFSDGTPGADAAESREPVAEPEIDLFLEEIGLLSEAEVKEKLTAGRNRLSAKAT